VGLQRDLARLGNAIDAANRTADFESGIELTASYLDREHEMEVLKQKICAELKRIYD